MDAPAANRTEPWLTAPNMRVCHGFTTRAGGGSVGPFSSLNLGMSSGDDAATVERNRDELLALVGTPRDRVCAFHQVHGARVLDGRPSWFEEEADAATTAEPSLALVVSVADCLPILFHDPVRGAIGAAHCGWRGTRLGLAGRVVLAMAERYGSRPEDVRVAVGPGILGSCYQVGPEVVRAFQDAGFPSTVAVAEERPDAGGVLRYRLDLVAANGHVLERTGVPPENVARLGRCTHCEPEMFYSHRRDHGRTGRHWAFIVLPS